MTAAEGKTPSAMLVFIDGDHEYVIFDPYSSEGHPSIINPLANNVSLEETGDSFSILQSSCLLICLLNVMVETMSTF